MRLREVLRKAGPKLDRIRRYWRRQVLRQPSPVDNWFADNGDLTLRLSYPLNRDSIVIDVGGFRGLWTQQIFERYQCTIHVFEPVLEYRAHLRKRFDGYPRIVVHPHGLSNHTAQARIALRGDASSVLIEDDRDVEAIELRDVAEALEPMRNSGIDLIKINIEGGEYDLLSRMIETGLTDVCQDIQIQFHSWVDGAVRRRTEIQHSLSRSHRMTYEYPLVWENWRRL